MSKELFWVNRDIGSGKVLQSSKEERSAIQSRIQRGRPRKRKSKAKSGQDIVSNSEPQQISRPKELYHHNSRHMTLVLDPFDTATVQLDSTISGLLRYYVFYYSPAQWPNEPFESRGPYTFKTAVNRVVSTAVQDDLMMFCLLTAASCRLQYVDHLSYSNVARNEDSYSAQALQLLRTRVGLEANPSRVELDALLQCIVFLVSAESYRNNFATARMHLKALLSLLDQRGGITILDNKHLREQILMGDLFLACVDLKPCLCGHDYDPGPSYLLELQDSEVDGASEPNELLGSSLSAQDTSVMPQELKDLVQQVIEVYLVKCQLRTEGITTKRALQIGHWITMRNMAVRNKILSFDYVADETNAIRMALIVWTLLTMNITGRLKTIKIMAHRLQQLLQRLSCESIEVSHGLHLWLLIIGYVCSSAASDTASWFLLQLYGVAELQLAMSVEECHLAERLKTMQHGFLYDDTIQGPLTEALAESLFALSNPNTDTAGSLPLPPADTGLDMSLTLAGMESTPWRVSRTKLLPNRERQARLGKAKSHVELGLPTTRR